MADAHVPVTVLFIEEFIIEYYSNRQEMAREREREKESERDTKIETDRWRDIHI